MSVQTTTPRPALKPSLRLRVQHNRYTVAAVAAAVVLYLISLIAVPAFVSFNHLTSLLNVAGILGVVAVGAGIVIIGGGIDLAIPNVVSIGIPPLVATLAVGGIVEGAQLMYTSGTPKSASPTVLQNAANNHVVVGLSGTPLIWIALTVMAVLLLSRTSLGRSIYAVGTNPRVAELAGINVRPTQIATYVISGVTAAIAGLLLLGFTATASSTVGDAYLLPAIAAVVLGGASILGGQGSAIGIAAGVFLLNTVTSLTTVLNLSNADQQIVEGGILLLVLAAYSGRLNLRRGSTAPWNPPEAATTSQAVPEPTGP
jgi:ribose transport system permease protein